MFIVKVLLTYSPAPVPIAFRSQRYFQPISLQINGALENKLTFPRMQLRLSDVDSLDIYNFGLDRKRISNLEGT